MKRTITALTFASLLAGCTPSGLLTPSLPVVPPPKPGKPLTAADRDAAKAKAAKPGENPQAKADSPRGPATAAQVSDHNAREMLKNLEAELDDESAQPEKR
jgi:hypothetical protein